MIYVYAGKEITELREALGMTPTGFAAAVGVSASAVNRWEHGNRIPKVEAIQAMNKLAKKAGLLPVENGQPA